MFGPAPVFGEVPDCVRADLVLAAGGADEQGVGTARAAVTVPSSGTLVVALGAAHRHTLTLVDGAVPALPTTVGLDPTRLGLPDGSYRLTATLTTTTGAVSRDTRVVVVDRTLGHLVARRLIRRGAPHEQIGFRLARAATVTVRVTTRAGRLLAVPLFRRRLGAGSHAVVWNQRHGRGLVSGGAVVTVTATTALGEHGLTEAIALARPPRGHR